MLRADLLQKGETILIWSKHKNPAEMDRNHFSLVWLSSILLVFLVVILRLLPDNSLDHFPNVCIWRYLGFSSCLGCGLTHATKALLDGKIALAWSYNPLAFIILPLMLKAYYNNWVRTSRMINRSDSIGISGQIRQRTRKIFSKKKRKEMMR